MLSVLQGAASDSEAKNQELSRAVEELSKLVKDTGEGETGTGYLVRDTGKGETGTGYLVRDTREGETYTGYLVRNTGECKTGT